MLRLLGAPPLVRSPLLRLEASPSPVPSPPGLGSPLSFEGLSGSSGRSGVTIIEIDEPPVAAVAPQVPGQRQGSRLARDEPAKWISMEEKAVKLRALRNALTGCSPRLQSRVAKDKMLDGVLQPLSAAAATAVRSATAIPSAPVFGRSDD